MSNTKAFWLRIGRAKTAGDFDKLETALTRLYENGIFTANEFMHLDHALLAERIAVETEEEEEE